MRHGDVDGGYVNLRQLQTLVVGWLDDPLQTYFTPALTLVWLNNAQKECQKRLLQAGENYYVIKASATMVINQPDYVLPSDFLKLHELQIVTSGTGVNENRQTLSPVTLVQLDQYAQTTGMPQVYNIKKNCFSVRCYPDQAYPMYLHYSYAIAELLNQTDTPDVPSQYHEYIAILAALNGYMKDGRDMSQLLAKRDWYEALMKQDMENRNVDAPRRVIMTDGEDFGSVY